uniref:Uncharacterized protein n=1 Tax=Cacopsylla melanoneura TaxID=428564 RepID=A0A8D8X8Z5_9HEMI
MSFSFCSNFLAISLLCSSRFLFNESIEVICFFAISSVSSSLLLKYVSISSPPTFLGFKVVLTLLWREREGTEEVEGVAEEVEGVREEVEGATEEGEGVMGEGEGDCETGEVKGVGVVEAPGRGWVGEDNTGREGGRELRDSGGLTSCLLDRWGCSTSK